MFVFTFSNTQIKLLKLITANNINHFNKINLVKRKANIISSKDKDVIIESSSEIPTI